MIVEANIETFNSLLKRRGFIWGPSPEIYGGLAGFYSYGPAGMALKNNILSIFRTELNSLGFGEVECPTIMPEIVWKASGHLERFIDPIIKCPNCATVFRADKFLQEKLHGKLIDGLSFGEMESLLKENSLTCSKCDTILEKIEEYNLMIKTHIGTDTTAFLRPETATTTYLLFNRLDQDARRQYPIQVFQYGKAYRNEISPRQGVLRMRAFDQFEIQLFISKEQEMDFPDFDDVKQTKLPLLDWKLQAKNIKSPKKTSLKEAISKGLLKKPAYAYCLYVAYYLTKFLGFPEEVIRFRQHSPSERAHYADDAWDLEISTVQFGLVEICGIHDRTNYDLKRHAEFSNKNFEVAMGKDPKQKEIPQILEIAFGIDRILYTLLESVFTVESERINLKLPSALAPNAVAVFPLVKNRANIVDFAKNVQKYLIKHRIKSFYDDVGGIGKRYRRQDELGTPFCVTIDYDSLTDDTVTLRYKDSMEQIRTNYKNLPDLLGNNN